MAQSRFQHASPADETPTGAYATHYFDAAHGDVAALHARIERGFADYSFGEAPSSPTRDRFDSAIRSLSRGAGVVGLLGTMLLIGILLF